MSLKSGTLLEPYERAGEGSERKGPVGRIHLCASMTEYGRCEEVASMRK
jgi:hypothetical protein